MITKENVDEVFTYHSPQGDQETRYHAIREEARKMAFVILSYTKVGADQQAALRKLRECVMTANASIALENVEGL